MYPILFKLGPIPIHSYGVLLAIGCAVGIWWASRNADRAKIESGQVVDVGIIVVLLGLVGARLAYVGLNWADYGSHLGEIIAVWDGGLTFFGGLVLGGVAGFLWAWANQVSISKLADLMAPAIAVAYAVSRIGCFLNGCCYGHECGMAWAVRFHADGGDMLTVPSHPVQVYSSILSLVLFALLLWLMRRGLPDGRLFGIWVVFSSLERIFVETFRRGATAEPLWGALTQAQAFSLLLAVLGVIIILRSGRKAAPRHVG